MSFLSVYDLSFILSIPFNIFVIMLSFKETQKIYVFLCDYLKKLELSCEYKLVGDA